MSIGIKSQVGVDNMSKDEFKEYLYKKQLDIAEEGKGVKDIMAALTYRCCINLLEEVIEKYESIED